MEIDPQELERHYSSLSDEALLDINRDDLVEAAQGCLDRELARRGLHVKHAAASDAPAFTEDDPAVPVSNFTYPDEAAEAREALESEGIPCYLAQQESESEAETQQYRGLSGTLLLMVPASFSDRALAVLLEQFGPEDDGLEGDEEPLAEESSAQESAEDAQ